MRLRPYIPEHDFETIRPWIDDERAHALWCANLIPYPLAREGFEAALRDLALRFGDTPFVATTDGGAPVGFFCYDVDADANEGKLKFVMVDSALRGRGVGREMLALALKYAFDITGVDAVRLSVFAENPRARRCYLAAGFAECATTPDAFRFRDESWGRCAMVARRPLPNNP